MQFEGIKSKSYGKGNRDEYNCPCRDVAQLGSALPWGGRGLGFKSRRSDQLKEKAAGFIPCGFACYLSPSSQNRRAYLEYLLQ